MRAIHTMSNNALGASAAVTATVCFTLNDVTVKFLSGDFALPQLMFLRAIIAIAVLAGLLISLERPIQKPVPRHRGLLILRGVLMVLANLFFFLGIAVLPLADTVGIFFVCPMIITAFSVIFLKETVGIRRWMAVGLGLLGVIVMMRPGTEGFQIAMLLPILAAIAYALCHILTRNLGRAVSGATMAIYMQLTFLVLMGLLGLIFGGGQLSGQGGVLFEFLLRPWVLPAGPDIVLLVFIGFATAGSNYFVSQAYRLGEASLVAPLEYVAIPIGVILGVLVFGDWPSLSSWIGITLIVSAGLFLLWREQQAGDTEATPARRK